MGMRRMKEDEKERMKKNKKMKKPENAESPKVDAGRVARLYSTQRVNTSIK